MVLALKILLMVLVFIMGIICLNNPIMIAKMVATMTRPLYKIMTVQGTVSKIQEAFHLLETNIDKYQEVFHFQMTMIRLTGYTALVVSAIGTCILLVGN